jgi:AraC-like DNA-binding protein
MNYQTFSPPDVLKPYVRFLWALESNCVDNMPATFCALPDGCPGLMFHRADNGAFCNNNNKKLPGILLYGQSISPARLSTTGKLSTVGICFYPHALKSVFGMDAHELTGSCIDLTLLQNNKERRLHEKLWEADTLEEQVNLLTAYLLHFIQNKGNQNDAVTQYALSEIVHRKGSISLKELQTKLQLSERTFERRFKQAVGISPKLFARICRFQETLNMLRKNKFDKLSDIAYENGYADQSHFIRSFKEFAGVSPFEYKKQMTEVEENFPGVNS